MVRWGLLTTPQEKGRSRLGLGVMETWVNAWW